MKSLIVIIIVALLSLNGFAHSIETQGMYTFVEAAKRLEGFRDTTYLCEGGIPTIGYGETDPKIVAKGRISKEEAYELLCDRSLSLDAQVSMILGGDKWISLKANQQAALMLLADNIGITEFENSSVVRAIKTGRYDKIESCWMLFIKVSRKGEKVLSKGLVRRRIQEYVLFVDGELDDDYKASKRVEHYYGCFGWKEFEKYGYSKAYHDEVVNF